MTARKRCGNRKDEGKNLLRIKNETERAIGDRPCEYPRT